MGLAARPVLTRHFSVPLGLGGKDRGLSCLGVGGWGMKCLLEGGGGVCVLLLVWAAVMLTVIALSPPPTPSPPPFLP